MQANEVLLAGRKLTAQEAYERNLVSEVFPAGQFQGKIKEIVSNMAKLPPQVCRRVHTWPSLLSFVERLSYFRLSFVEIMNLNLICMYQLDAVTVPVEATAERCSERSSGECQSD